MACDGDSETARRQDSKLRSESREEQGTTRLASGSRHVVAPVADIPPGERRIFEVAGRSIGVFNVDGRFFAVRNSCPHQGGPLCLGPTVGLATSRRPGEITYTREGEILRCPWHGWEFDLETGRSVFDPARTRVKGYPVEVEELQAETFPVEIEQERVVIILV
jgi:nitrite reductase/ring-hydroxylating ferredoxin subunit